MATAFVGSDELWRDCATWLTKWDLLRSDHRANWPEAGIVDLANTLRDGVLLCNLLGRIDPGCVDMKDVNLKPAMAQFLCLRNIKIFLKTATMSFGLRESDLFDPLMLFDLTNFHKVLCTLSKLSQSSKSLRSGIAGFIVPSSSSKEDEDIYQSLKSVDVIGGNETPWLHFTIPCPRLDDREEEVYGDLCYVTFSQSLPELLGVHPPLEKRDFVMKELIETEHNYVEVINKLQKNFMRPLQMYLKAEYHSVIFCKVNELQEIHTKFLNQLLKIGVDKSVRLSNVFIVSRERFLVYGKYCANLSNACSLLQEICEKDETVNHAIMRCEKEYNNGKFKLRDVLSVPMQRILKYHLLLEKLIDLTDPNHEEYKELKRAREAMLDVAGFINESARDSEHLAVIKKVFDNIIEWDVSEPKFEFGRLIRDGEIKIKAHDDQKVRSRYAFIFDKVMILCKQLKSGQFAYRDLLHLADCKVDNNINRPILNKEARWSYQWLLYRQNVSMAYTCYARSIEMKSKMIKALNEAIDNVKPAALAKTNHKFEMFTFEKPLSCNKCSKYLKGLVFQGYRCSVCQVPVHKECIATSGRCRMPPLPPPHLHHNDTRLTDKLWFVGDMDRNRASAVLENRLNGTYLVRIRSNSDNSDRFALSLKTDNTVKHMKICCDVNGLEEKYYLSPSKYFNSIEHLIENYQNSSLKENFERLEEHTKLEFAYQQIVATVIRDYIAEEAEQLDLREDESVVVVGQEGYREGWWKGRKDNRVGYFPRDCIRICTYVTDEV